jgi:hypothetical protein
LGIHLALRLSETGSLSIDVVGATSRSVDLSFGGCYLCPGPHLFQELFSLDLLTEDGHDTLADNQVLAGVVAILILQSALELVYTLL